MGVPRSSLTLLHNLPVRMLTVSIANRAKR